MSRAYNQLCKALVKAGLPSRSWHRVKGVLDVENEDPVELLVNTGIDAAPYAKLLLRYASQITDNNELDMVIRCMIQPKGFPEAVPWLISLFKGWPKNGYKEYVLWAAGNAIYMINAKEHYPEVISLCRVKRFGEGRQMLMYALARARTDEAYDLLVKCLTDPSVRAQAIEALGRFGRTDAIPILEKLTVRKDHYEYQAKELRCGACAGCWRRSLLIKQRHHESEARTA